jgi:hypothetical protein
MANPFPGYTLFLSRHFDLFPPNLPRLFEPLLSSRIPAESEQDFRDMILVHFGAK